MFLRFIIVLLSIFLYCNDGFAQEEIKRVAVLEFRGIGIEEAMLLKLSDQARRGALDTLSKDEYLIITRENMMQVLSDMGKEVSCMQGACEIELGRNIGADLIITGDILKIESSYVLTLKLYETKNAGLLQIEEVQQESLLKLKEETYSQSILLVQEGLQLDEKSARKGRKGSSNRKNKKEARKKKREQNRERHAKIYKGIAGGVFLGSTAMYSVALIQKNRYNSAETLLDARNAYQMNTLSHTIATSLFTSAALLFTAGQLKSRKHKKEQTDLNLKKETSK